MSLKCHHNDWKTIELCVFPTGLVTSDKKNSKMCGFDSGLWTYQPMGASNCTSSRINQSIPGVSDLT